MFSISSCMQSLAFPPCSSLHSSHQSPSLLPPKPPLHTTQNNNNNNNNNNIHDQLFSCKSHLLAHTHTHKMDKIMHPNWKCSSIPIASLAMHLMSPGTVEAGILSGTTGLESFELPRLPQADVFKQITEANKQRYKDLDAKFKASPFLEELLKRSKENALKNKKEIEEKYCLRGAEWGVGDCSLAAASKDVKEAFRKALEKRNSAN